MVESPSDPEFWRAHWRRERQGWELGRAAPPLERWFAAHPPAGRRALVVGCGRGHEARLLARGGADVVAVDFAAEAIAQARALADAEGLRIDFRQRDLFTLDGETFDLAVEHCCFCAIDPARRDEYVDVMARLVRPGGELVGLFYAHGRPGGPPFATDRAELERRFAPRFSATEIAVADDSIATRAGHELLARFRRR